MNQDPNPKPMNRRAFMADLASAGAILLGSVALAGSVKMAGAIPSPSPPEHDRIPKPGEMPPPSPTPSPKPTASPRPGKTTGPKSSPSGCPSELDRVTPSGGLRLAPRPAENDNQAKPGKIAVPHTPSPSPSTKPKAK